MRPERDDLAAAAEYICVRLHPHELRFTYVNNVRNQHLGDLIGYVLQDLDVGMTNLFIGLLGAYLYDKFKKPDPNIERLLNGQRAMLAQLDELINKETSQKEMERGRAGQQFHESVLRKIENSDPEIPAMVEDALRQLKARGAKALVNDVHAAGNRSEVPAEDAPMMRWWHRPD